MSKSLLAAVCLTAAAWGLAGQYGDVPHYDHRTTPHLQFIPDDGGDAGLTGEAQAYDFITRHAGTYRLHPADLVFVRTQTSLTATHYHYTQHLDGTPVLGGDFVVSVSHATGKVSRIYNNTFPVPAVRRPQIGQLLTSEDAFDVAWDHLGVRGDLLSQPAALLAWQPVGTDFRLVWQVDLDVAEPHGAWRTLVDAGYGKIVDVQNRQISRKPTPALQAYDGPIYDRAAAFARFEAEQQRLSRAAAKREGAALVDGTGVVFDPDPRTTLNDASLTDSSPASAFTDAYFTRALPDLEFTGGTYRLNGPWISIIDWDPPTNAPSTTTDGNWTATRGDNAFNDAMTYFQIHQSQVYIQSLGFTGATGIQEGPIGTDTDGASGADNSYFQPGSNRMAFGHGCVDDNEDADVILHEYGHAIHHSINSNWGGGDAGAIGEGFGDYWAGSYSYSTPNGPVFHPEWVFSWDGHSNCWDGRLLDKTTMMYDPSRTYGAHQGVPGGQSDELWSAPIFNAFLDLIGMGRDREEMDQIILESHFGLGSGVTMRILGNATVSAAAELQPGQPHAGVYTDRFLAQNIIDIPHVGLEASDLIVDSEPGGNGQADPGETVDLQLRILNGGNLLASSVSAMLSSSDPNVTVDADSSPYPDLGIGSSAANSLPFTITLSSNLTCGDTVTLDLDVSWTDTSLAPGSTQLSFTLTTGEVLGLSAVSTPALPIPDNTTVMDVITTASTDLVTADFNVDVDISHTYIGDLTVTLRAPDGTEVILHNESGGGAADIVGNYPGTLTPAQSLSALVGKSHTGDWTLVITDSANSDTGTLNSWGLNDISGYECDGALPFCFGDLNGDRVVDPDDYLIAQTGWASEVGDADASGTATILDMLSIEAAYGDCD